MQALKMSLINHCSIYVFIFILKFEITWIVKHFDPYHSSKLQKLQMC